MARPDICDTNAHLACELDVTAPPAIEYRAHRPNLVLLRYRGFRAALFRWHVRIFTQELRRGR